ncbi:MAG: ATP-binding protein [Anaerolineae bacterium]
MDWTQEFTGAYATTNLVGREEILAAAEKAFEYPSSQPSVLFLTGEGGIGKTRIVQSIIESAKSNDNLQVTRSIVDFYHVPTHSEYGLAEALHSVLTPPRSPFTRYENEKRALERMRLSGEVSNVGEQRLRVLQAFTEDMTRLAQGKRIVLTLDTAERLVYSVGQEPVTPILFADCWNWLVQSLPQWKNVTLVIAGRDSARPLVESLRRMVGEDFVSVVPVGSFSEAESIAYFDEVAHTARKHSRLEIAQRVQSLDRDARLLAHRLAGGRPIMLALLVDYLTAGPGSLSEILHPAEQNQGLTDRHYGLARLKTQLVGRLMELRPLGDVISALGRTPKGCDQELLAKLLDIPVAEAGNRLNDTRRLSIIKVRPADQRVFLHDEIYALLREEVYAHPADVREAARFSNVILTYYDEQIDRCRTELDRLYAPAEVEGKEKLDLSRLSETHTTLQTLWAEFVFYELRRDAAAGFRHYYRLIREASLNGDTQWDVQLQAELQTFLAEWGVSPSTEFIDDLPMRLVRSSLMPRSMVRALVNGQLQAALTEGEHLRRTMSDIIAMYPVVNEGILNAWEASALIYLGGEENLKMARDKLTLTIGGLHDLLRKDPQDHGMQDIELWRSRAVLAFAHRIRGYLFWVLGLLQDSAKDYRQAAALWRRVNLKIEMATTLKDMGFVLSEAGESVTGRNLVKDALALQRELGPRSPVGLSLNTLAKIDIHEGAYESAIVFSEKALVLFRALGDQRGIGLALLALAEAKRRASGTEKVPAPENKVELLRAARDHAQEALEVFQNIGEKMRQIEALIECGCACRDWVHVRSVAPSFRDDVERLAQEAAEMLARAAEMATDSMIYKKVDALVNLAWLRFYAAQDSLLEDAAQKANAAIPDEYRIRPLRGGRPKISSDRVQVSLWPQLGKLYTLEGHRAFKNFEKTHVSDSDQQKQHLKMATRNYALGLEYDVFYSPDHRGLRQMKEQVYENFKRLNSTHLTTVYQVVQGFEAEFALKDSEMRRLLEQYALQSDA